MNQTYVHLITDRGISYSIGLYLLIFIKSSKASLELIVSQTFIFRLGFG
jgi:hypothetical protein